MAVLLGAIADDFTGATDLSNTLVRGGMRVVQTVGVPADGLGPQGADAVVVSLKTRTMPVEGAVSASLAALRWLRGLGPRQFYFKYCSTFDSSAQGNIGPVADALLAELGADFALVCPAFPGNGRTVYMGHLFVGRDLLSESPMKDHPLTPMRDASLVRLMAAQSRHRVGLVAYDVVSQGVAATAAACEGLRAGGFRFAVADALEDGHLATIGAAAKSHRLVTGGSGVAAGLVPNFREAGLLGQPVDPGLPNVAGPAAVLAGSCSTATRGQVAAWQRQHPHFRVDASRVAQGEDVVGAALAWARQAHEQPVLIYSSDSPDEVAAIQARHGRAQVSSMIEDAMGRIASGLVTGGGVRRLIVAGGETSGAVVSALGIVGLRICREIEPGVPWTVTMNEPRIALALKSGNFGSEDFFYKALAMLQ